MVSIEHGVGVTRIVMPPARRPLVFVCGVLVLVPAVLFYVMPEFVYGGGLGLLFLAIALVLTAPVTLRILWEAAGIEEVVLDAETLTIRRTVLGFAFQRRSYELFESSSLAWRRGLPLFGGLMNEWNLGNAWAWGNRMFFVHHGRVASFGWNLEDADAPAVYDAVVAHDRAMRQRFGLPLEKGLGCRDDRGLEHAIFETQQEEPMPWTWR